MAEEKSPFEEERSSQEEMEKQIIPILAAALFLSTKDLTRNSTVYEIREVLNTFFTKSSEIIPILSSYIPANIRVGLERFKKNNTFNVDFTSEEFSRLASEIFSENFDYIQKVNDESLSTLEEEKQKRGWSDTEFIKRIKLLFGLSSLQIIQTLSYEDSLILQDKPKLDKDSIAGLVQTRVDRLQNWRIKLIATRLSVALTEESKLASWIHLEDSFQIPTGVYGKQWVSVIDEVTTQTCINTNNEIVTLQSTFSNGSYTPPAMNPIHPCRSSLRLVKL